MYRGGVPLPTSQYDSGMDWVPDNGRYGAGSGRHGRTHSSSRQSENGYVNAFAPPPNIANPRRHSTAGRRESLGSPYVHGLQMPPIKGIVAAGAPGQAVLECRNPEDPTGTCRLFRHLS